MQKDLLSKLLKAGLNVKTNQVSSETHQGKYKTSILFRKEYSSVFWTISSSGSNEEISLSIEKAYDAFYSELTRLISCIDTLYSVKCWYNIRCESVLTDLNIRLEERIEGNLKTYISHEVSSSDSAESLLIQAKKFIVDELTKIKESIS